MLKHVTLLVCLAGPAVAQECPPAPDRSGELAFLFNRANAARSPIEARPIADAMWSIWADAPDDRAQALLDDGRELIGEGDLDDATEVLDDLVEYCPDYAEGYNQRAFAAYLQGEFAAALVDLNAALERQPLHVAALSGKALTLIGLGRGAEGQRVLRQALKLNPWLSERALLREMPEDTF